MTRGHCEWADEAESSSASSCDERDGKLFVVSSGVISSNTTTARRAWALQHSAHASLSILDDSAPPPHDAINAPHCSRRTTNPLLPPNTVEPISDSRLDLPVPLPPQMRRAGEVAVGANVCVWSARKWVRAVCCVG